MLFCVVTASQANSRMLRADEFENVHKKIVERKKNNMKNAKKEKYERRSACVFNAHRWIYSVVVRIVHDDVGVCVCVCVAGALSALCVRVRECGELERRCVCLHWCSELETGHANTSTPVIADFEANRQDTSSENRAKTVLCCALCEFTRLRRFTHSALFVYVKRFLCGYYDSTQAMRAGVAAGASEIVTIHTSTLHALCRFDVNFAPVYVTFTLFVPEYVCLWDNRRVLPQR